MVATVAAAVAIAAASAVWSAHGSEAKGVSVTLATPIVSGAGGEMRMTVEMGEMGNDEMLAGMGVTSIAIAAMIAPANGIEGEHRDTRACRWRVRVGRTGQPSRSPGPGALAPRRAARSTIREHSLTHRPSHDTVEDP